MLVTILLFLLSAAAIYWACEYFVNGIEWCGLYLKLGAMAVGAVLAAFGTALPESSVTLFAVAFGHSQAQKDLGVGAAMGGPLALSTLAYAVVGFAMLANRRKLGRAGYSVQVDQHSIGRDQLYFLAIFCANLLLGLTDLPHKGWFGWIFLAAYAVYAWQKMGAASDTVEETEPEALRIRRGKQSSLGWAALQTLLALAVIAIASRVFVMQLGAIGVALHWPPQMTALLLSPIATELPETLNALIWIRQGKERLALANISGAMMIQATVPSALGLFFTSWRFDRPLAYSALATIASIIFLWLLFRRAKVDSRALVGACVFYALFAVALVSFFTQRWERIPAADRARLNPFAGQSEAVTVGAKAFQSNCASCHQSQTKGGPAGPTLHNARLRKATDGQIEWFLRQGVADQGMPTWATLPERERWQIVAYLKSIQ